MPNAANEGGSQSEAIDVRDFVWAGAAALRRVHALNERCLERLSQLARSDLMPISPETVQRERGLWRSLNPNARKQAAQMPVLLVEAHFRDAQWWHWARAPHAVRRHRIPARNAFSGRGAGELMRETLMLAWNTVALDRKAAMILLGMAPNVSAIIAELDVHDVERIAAKQSRDLQLRWDGLAVFWSRLLNAAIQGDEDTLHACRLHSIQLMGGELLPLLERGHA